MKNLIKNNVFGFIMGIIITSGIGVVATVLYNCNQVVYIPDDNSITATNVEEALNQLYDKTNNLKLGTNVTRGTAFTVNRSTYTVPYDWDKENVAFVVIYAVYGINYNGTISNYDGGPYIITSWDSTYHYTVQVVLNPKVGDKFYCTGGNYGLTFYPYYYN